MMSSLDFSKQYKYKNHICEYVDNEYVIFSKGTKLYKFCALSEELIGTWSFGADYFYNFIPYRLAYRLLRKQFYNVIRIDGEKFLVFFDKSLYLIDSFFDVELLCQFEFRVLRNSYLEVEGSIYFGEYRGNVERSDISIYKFDINRLELSKIYTFNGDVRHIHAIREYKQGYLLVLTGDIKNECGIFKFSIEEGRCEELFRGEEKYRSIYSTRIEDFILYATDAQYIRNEIRTFDIETNVNNPICDLDGPVFYGAKLGKFVILSIVWEGDIAQVGDEASLVYLSTDDFAVNKLIGIKKDLYSKKYFQFGQFFLPNICPNYSGNRIYASTWALSGGCQTFEIKTKY